VEISPQVREALQHMSVGAGPAELTVATDTLIEQCMHDKGFTYTTSQPQPNMTGEGNLSGALGLLDEADADRNGYGYVVVKWTPPTTEATDAAASRTPEYNQALLGGADPASAPRAQIDGYPAAIPKEGCVADARARVYGSLEDYLRVTQLPLGLLQFSKEAGDDEGVREAAGRYSSCMEAAGYPDVKNLKDAGSLAKERFGRPQESEPSPEERSMAVADARCQRSSGTKDALNDATLRVGGQWVKEHEGELLAVYDLERESLGRAKDVIENAPSR
jgi:hypothetical protein